jgi:hypothetical protein
VLDAGLLVGAGVSFSFAIKHRNDFANDRDDSLAPANNWLSVGIGIGIALVVTRIASGLGYAYGQEMWIAGAR